MAKAKTQVYASYKTRRSISARVVVNASRLAGLIHQELAERGHLNQFLSKMGVCGVDETSRSGATVSPSTVTYQVPNPHGGSEDLLTGFAPGGVGTQLAQDPAPQSSTATAIGAICTATNATALEVQLSQRVVASIDGDGAPTCTATPAPSVLDAAVAAYKQEKQRLWKVGRNKSRRLIYVNHFNGTLCQLPLLVRLSL